MRKSSQLPLLEVFDEHDAFLERDVTITRFTRNRAFTFGWLNGMAGPWSAVHHPGVAKIYQITLQTNVVDIVSERLTGPSLGEHVEDKPMGPDDFRWFVESLCNVLHHAHSRRVSHGALSSDAIVLGPDRTLKLLRFPPEHLSSMLTDETPGPPPSVMSFKAPEQLGAKVALGLVDVYALGGILYHAVTGRLPFSASNYTALFEKILSGRPQRLSVPLGFPAHLSDVIEGCLRKDPANRFRACDQLSDFA